MADTRAVTARLAAVGARAAARRAPVPLSDAVALAGVGFEALCEVVGAISLTDADGGFYTSGWIAADFEAPRTYTTSPANQRVGVPATLTTRKRGFARAYARLLDEARVVGADGVVGLTVQSAYEGIGAARLLETVILGTAVRAIAPSSLARPRPSGGRPPFTTSLSGVQMSAALQAGLVPVTYLQTPVMAVRYVDPASALQIARRAANGEVEALTDLLTVCRERARADFHRAATSSGADVAVVDDVSAELHMGSGVAGMHTATATVTGTALASFRATTVREQTLTVVPLATTTQHPKRSWSSR